MSEKYILKTATLNDVREITYIYNSNKTFLEHHLGVPMVSNKFILCEIKEMSENGFLSRLIIDKQTEDVVGLCDYKIEDCVYLSLLMLNGKLKGQGRGSRIYKYLEGEFAKEKASSVRIDVIDDYEGNVVGFWEKQGFILQDRIVLEWGGKKSSACVMKKIVN